VNGTELFGNNLVATGDDEIRIFICMGTKFIPCSVIFLLVEATAWSIS